MIYGIIDALGPEYVKGWKSSLGDGQYVVAYMFLCLGLALGVHGSFVVDVIMNICEYLDIWCLTIKHPKFGKGVEKTGETKDVAKKEL